MTTLERGRRRYYCPPQLRGVPPWCAALPCAGHPATKMQVLVARVLAYEADEDRDMWWDPRRTHDVNGYLTRARIVLRALEPRSVR